MLRRNVLCNFCETVEIAPAVNQVELNPFFTQEDALANMKNYGVQPMAWLPLAEGPSVKLCNKAFIIIQRGIGVISPVSLF